MDLEPTADMEANLAQGISLIVAMTILVTTIQVLRLDIKAIMLMEQEDPLQTVEDLAQQHNKKLIKLRVN